MFYLYDTCFRKRSSYLVTIQRRVIWQRDMRRCIHPRFLLNLLDIPSNLLLPSMNWLLRNSRDNDLALEYVSMEIEKNTFINSAHVRCRYSLRRCERTVRKWLFLSMIYWKEVGLNMPKYTLLSMHIQIMAWSKIAIKRLNVQTARHSTRWLVT